MSFDQLGLSEKVLEAVRAAGFETPTPIQSKAIPPTLERRDVLGLAQTGSGKTAAFALPMLSLLETGQAPHAADVDPRAHPGTGGAGPGSLRAARPQPPPDHRAADRRRVVRRAE